MDRETALKRRQGARLRDARKAAGYNSARSAAVENRWVYSTYGAHERGKRTIGQDDAERYAKRYAALGVAVTAKTILFDGEEVTDPWPLAVPVVGFVSDGAQAHFHAKAEGPVDEVPAPEGATDDTKAVEIRGDSLGSFFDRWLVYYDDVRRPVTADLIGPLCVVGLADGRVLIKKIQRSRARGLFHLISQFDPPILDVAVEWAAKVKTMTPR